MNWSTILDWTSTLNTSIHWLMRSRSTGELTGTSGPLIKSGGNRILLISWKIPLMLTSWLYVTFAWLMKMFPWKYQQSQSQFVANQQASFHPCYQEAFIVKISRVQVTQSLVTWTELVVKTSPDSDVRFRGWLRSTGSRVWHMTMWLRRMEANCSLLFSDINDFI